MRCILTSPSAVPARCWDCVEGYMGNDDALYYVSADFDGGTLRFPNTREVSIEHTTTQCRQRNGRAEYELRGFTHDPATGTVSLYNVTNSNSPPVLIGPQLQRWTSPRLESGASGGRVRAPVPCGFARNLALRQPKRHWPFERIELAGSRHGVCGESVLSTDAPIPALALGHQPYPISS